MVHLVCGRIFSIFSPEIKDFHFILDARRIARAGPFEQLAQTWVLILQGFLVVRRGWFWVVMSNWDRVDRILGGRQGDTLARGHVGRGHKLSS